MKPLEEGAPTPFSHADVERRERFQRDAIPLLEHLFRRATWLTRNRADAEDLVQDTMINAYTYFHTFRQDSNLNAWLNRIMTNAYIDTHRKAKRQPPSFSIDQISAELLAAQSPNSTTGASAEDQALSGTLDAELATAVRSLPEVFRVAIYYADVEGLSYNEIAEITGAERGTVMSRLHRGRRRLRSMLSAAEPGPSESVMPVITGSVVRVGITATQLR